MFQIYKDNNIKFQKQLIKYPKNQAQCHKIYQHKFKQLLKDSYEYRLNIVQQFYKELFKFNAMYVLKVEKPPSNKYEFEFYLRNIYGGPSYHIVTTYLEAFPGDSFHNNINKSRSQIVSKVNLDIEVNKYLSQINKNSNDSKLGLQVKYCDHSCEIPKFWATRLYSSFSTLDSKLSIDALRRIIVKNETCYHCHGQYHKCKDSDMCGDTLQCMNIIAVHYRGLRTLVRNYYRLRHYLIFYIELNQAIANFQVNALKAMIYSDNNSQNITLDIINNKQPTIQSGAPTEYSENFLKLSKIYKHDLDRRLDFVECLSCHKLFSREYTRELPENIIDQNLAQIFSPSAKKKIVCRSFCFNDIASKKCIPKFSILNNMKLDETPEVIKKLRQFELILCQRAKCFQTVTKLHSINGAKYFKGTPALKGVSIHLPLNQDETNEYIQTTLPNIDAIDIIVTSLPTKQMTAWRSGSI